MSFANPGSRKQAARIRSVTPVTPLEPDSNDPAFQSCVDFAALNSGIHQASRTDTFRTPSRLSNNSPDSPSRSHMEGIYKRGAPKDGVRLTRQILEDIQDLQETTIGMRKQLSESWTREAHMADVLTQVGEKIHFLHSKAMKTASNADANKLDMTPLYEEFHCSEKRNAELMSHLTQQVENRLSGHIGQVREELQEVTRHQKMAEDVHFVEVMEEIRKTDVQVQKSLSKAAEDTANAASEERSRKAQETEGEAALKGVIQKFDAHQTRLNNDHFDRVMAQIKATQHTFSTDNRTLLAELAKIQQALHVDFAQVVDELKGINQPHDDEAAEKKSGDDESIVAVETGHEDGDHLDEDGEPHAITFNKRFRHFWAQTDFCDKKDGYSMTDDSLLTDAGYTRAPARQRKQRKVKKEPDTVTAVAKVKAKKAVFADAEQMKRKMREQLMKQQYNVVDYYHTTGYFQALATSWSFEHLTLFVIFCNAIWIAIDTDLNPDEVLYDAHPVFIAAENSFCTYFTFELIVRFMAFNGKKHCFKDNWFVFDLVLVLLMILETWIINGLLMVILGDAGAAGTRNASILRMVRMVRMLRISRMARLLRSIPELVVLIKGIKAASRSVMVFFLLWFIIIYVFAVLFKQLTNGEDIGIQYFATVPDAMNTLLLDGILPDHSILVNDLTRASPGLFPLIMFFIMLAAVTVMYMLVGVLVDVVVMVSSAEKEGMTVASLAAELRNLFNHLGRSEQEPITQFEFRNLTQNLEFQHIVQSANVDVLMLLDMLDIIYEDAESQTVGLTFERFIELILSMRGDNQASVKDIKEQIKVVRNLVCAESDRLFWRVHSEFARVQRGIEQLEEDILEEIEEHDDQHVRDPLKNSWTNLDSVNYQNRPAPTSAGPFRDSKIVPYPST